MAYHNMVCVFCCTVHMEMIEQDPSLLFVECSWNALAACISRIVTITLQIPTSYLFSILRCLKSQPV